MDILKALPYVEIKSEQLNLLAVVTRRLIAGAGV
jgi:hypothetical protein